MDELPIFEVTIDPEFQKGENELGLDAIALTNDPAIMVKGIAFKSQKKELFADDKKYRITAPAMIPMDIYRRDEDGEYEVRFTEKTIEDLFVKFMGGLRNQDIFNLEHEGNDIAPAFILEAWLVDNPKEDKAYSTFGLEVPKGTLMLTAQITDKDYYNEIVENEQFGFSIEAFLGLTEPSKLNNHHMLPNGKFTLDGKEYEVVGGNIKELAFEVEDEVKAVTEEPQTEVAEEVAEPVAEPVAEVAMMEEGEEEEKEAEEEMMDEPKEEEMAVDPEADREAILAIVQPMFDELYSVIAELKEEMGESEEVAPSEDAEVEMSAAHKFSSLVKFLR